MSEICCTFASSFVYVYATYTNERTLKYAINYLGCPLILRGLDRVIYGFPDNSPSSAKQRNWEFNYDPPFSAKQKRFVCPSLLEQANRFLLLYFADHVGPGANVQSGQ